MPAPDAAKSGFEKWQDGLSTAKTDDQWNAWDCEIQAIVTSYNQYLVGKSGFLLLDWRLIKAMIWVETGARSSEWKSKPMQIGVLDDPGLDALLSDAEGGNLVMPPALRKRLTAETVRKIPSDNISAGVGYLLMRMANYEFRTIASADQKVYIVTVKAGDSLDKIARANGTTTDMLRQLNPGVNVLRPGQNLKYRKASMQKVISGWKKISTAIIAKRYNGDGDENYEKKLNYALSLVNPMSPIICAQ